MKQKLIMLFVALGIGAMGLEAQAQCIATSASISTTDPTRICVDDIGDPIDVTIDTGAQATSTWVITDEIGTILALPPGPPFDLNGAGPGTCQIWYVTDDGIDFAPMAGGNLNAMAMAATCTFLSNPIVVDRIEVTAPLISTMSPTTICADDGVPDMIMPVVDDAGIGVNTQWVITEASGIILGLPPAPPFNLEGAGAGTCLVYYVNYEDPMFALNPGDNVNAAVAGASCAALSNSIAVVRTINCNIPTVGQWGLIVFVLMVSSIGLIGLRETKIENVVFE